MQNNKSKVRYKHQKQQRKCKHTWMLIDLILFIPQKYFIPCHNWHKSNPNTQLINNIFFNAQACQIPLQTTGTQSSWCISIGSSYKQLILHNTLHTVPTILNSFIKLFLFYTCTMDVILIHLEGVSQTSDKGHIIIFLKFISKCKSRQCNKTVSNVTRIKKFCQFHDDFVWQNERAL